MRTLMLSLLFISCIADNFIRFPYPGLPGKDIDGKSEYKIFRKKQQAYLLINMLRVDPQGFVAKYMKPVIADNSWRLLFKTESIRLKKFPDYYPLYQDTLLEQTATHARLGESFANVRARLAKRLPERFEGYIPGYKPVRLLAQTMMWKTKTQNDFFSYICHGQYQEYADHCGSKDLVLAGCKADYINRKTPRGRIRFLLRPYGAVGCNNINTLIKDENLFACDITYPDFAPRLRVKSPMIAGNWFYSGIGNSRIYAVVIHVPRHEKISKVELIIDGKRIQMPMSLQNGVSKVFSVSYTPLRNVPSLMKGYFFHAVINGKNFFYPAQFYYDWEDNMKLDAKQRYNGFCKVPFPDRTCEICDDGYRNVNGDCVKCTMDNCSECNADVCTKCAPGFLLSGGECKTQCIEHCEVCSYASTCDKCKPTHYLEKTNGTCVECSKKFNDCATCTEDKCLTFFCQHQDEECARKKTLGLYYSETTQKCEHCSEGCKRCVYDQFKGSKCTMCNNGLFLTSEGECIPCHYVDGCAPGQCDGYKCLRCKMGYYPLNKGCAKCDETCAFCRNNGTCVKCADGFTLDPEWGKCVENYQIEHCAKKSAGGHCIKCEKGYGFDKYQKCVACDASCKECSYADKCEVCKDTFYNVNGHCVPCSQRGCDLCDTKECFSCQPHSYLHNGVCVRGPAGCSLCHDKAPICKVCEKGMKMKDGHCIPDCDVKNCAKCNGDETCRYCKSTLNPYGGYEPAPNATEPCPFVCDPVELNCLLTDKMKRGEVDACFALGCKYCPPHTFRQDHKCVPCGEGCDKCLNEKECIKCKAGYSYYLGKCYKCNKNGTCGEGEYMDDCTCKACNKKFEHCVACDKEQCIKCKPYFTLAQNKTKCVPCTGKECLPKPLPNEPPKHPDCEKDCPPCPVEEIPVEEKIVKKCEKQLPYVRVGDEYVIDSNCEERDEDCYCTKCPCNYKLDESTHICKQLTLEEAESKQYDLEKFLNGNCEKKECVCGRNADDTCIEPKAQEGCKIVNCKEQCDECLEGYFLNGTKCDKCVEDHCGKCNNEKCLECVNGYYVNGTKCQQCEKENCCKCAEGVCLECCEGFYKNGTECTSCKTLDCKQCIEDDGKEVCTLCMDDSTPVDGVCRRALSLSRSGANEISIIVAVAMLLAILI